MPETPAKASYSLVGELHGMQGVSGSRPLGSTEFLETETNEMVSFDGGQSTNTNHDERYLTLGLNGADWQESDIEFISFDPTII